MMRPVVMFFLRSAPKLYKEDNILSHVSGSRATLEHASQNRETAKYDHESYGTGNQE
jgi:hypothetical protein